MKLHYAPRTRSFTALWMLEEVGAAYEIVTVDMRGPSHPAAALKAVNPMGKLPALEDGEAKFGETAAILIYLADKFPAAGLAPGLTDPRRGRFLQWMMFPATTIEPAAFEKMTKSPGNPTAAGWGSYERMVDVVAGALAPGRNLFDTAFTAADLYMASSLKFMMTFGMVEKRAVFEDFVDRAEARPAWARATAIEAARTPG